MKVLGSLVAALLLAMVLFASAASAESHDPVVSVCYVTSVSGPVAHISCEDPAGSIIPGGQVDLPEVINEVLVPGPTVTLPPETVTLPPIKTTVTLPPLPVQTRTVTLPPLPRATETRFLPRPTETRTVIIPGEERTVTETQTRTREIFVPSKTRTVLGPVVTETAAPETISVTETVTASPTRQPSTDSGTISPGDVFLDPPALTAPEAAGIGALTLLFLGGLVLLALWGGYVLGYKDSDRENRKFMAALRDQFYYRGNHS